MNGRRPTAAVQHTSQSKRASRVGDGGGRAGRRGGRGVEADEDASQVELNTVLREASQHGVQLFKVSLISISVFTVKSR